MWVRNPLSSDNAMYLPTVSRNQLVWIWGPHPPSHWGLFHKNNCQVCHGLLLFEGPVCALTALTPQNFWLLMALQPHCKTFQQHMMSLSCCFHFCHCSHHRFHGLDSVTVVKYCSILLLFCILISFLWCCFTDFHSMVELLEIRQPDHPTIYTATQYLSLPHLFLLDSGSPVGFLLDSYWIPTKFPKRHFHIFFHFPQLDSYWTPTRFLLDSYWTPTELKQISQTECNGSDTGFLLESYWSIIQFIITNT